MKLPWWSALIALVVGFGICYWWPHPTPDPVIQRVEVPVYLHARPDTITKWLTRLTHVTVPPETVTVTREHFDTARVAGFCATARETTAAPILPPFAGRYREGRLELFSTLSNGQGWSASYPAHAPVEWASRISGEVEVRGARKIPTLLRVGLKLGGCAGLAYGVRSLTNDPGASLGAGGGCAVGQFLP